MNSSERFRILSVLKDRLARLGPAVRHALNDREMRRENVRSGSALNRSEALQQSVLSSLDAHIAVLNASGKIVSVNAAWERFAKANGDSELAHTGVGRNYVDVCRAASQNDASTARVLEGILSVLNGDANSFRSEYACDGTLHRQWFSMVVTPLADAAGGVVIAHQDITQRCLAERSLSRSKALLEAVAHASLDGLMVLNAVRDEDAITDFEIAFVNPRLEEMFNLTSRDLLGRRLLRLFPLVKEKGLLDLYAHLVDTGEPKEAETSFDVQGVEGWYLLTVVKVGDGAAVTVRDVTKQRERESALEQANARFEALGRHVPGMIYQLCREKDGSMHMPYVSHGTAELTGLAPEVLRDDARPLLEVLHPDDREDFEAGVMVSQETLEPWLWQGRVRIGDEVKWVRGASQPIRRPDGGTLWNGLVLDVTAQVKAKEALEESRRHQQALFEQSLDAVLIADDEARYVDANPAACKLLGRSREELLQMTIFDLTPGIDVESGIRLWKVFLDDGELSGDFRIETKDGHVRDVEFRAVANVLPGRHLSVMTDITKRKEAEFDRKRTGAIVESSNDAIMGITPDGILTNWNMAAERVLGYTADEMIGHGLAPIVPEDQRERVEELLDGMAAGQRVDGFETICRRRDGNLVEISLSLAPILDDNGVVVGGAAIARDIGSHNDALRRTLEAKARAEEMARLKSAFLTNMSHEIRTPLTGIIGFADILADMVSDEERELANFIALSGDRLMQTLTSVLDLAQLESGHTKLTIEHVDIVRHVRQTMDLLRPQAKRNGLHLELKLDGVGPFDALTDAPAVNRILTNLCSNAVKFTREGGIDVRISGDDRAVHVAVTDTGIGIDPAFIPYLFQEYTQESAGTSRSFEGSGLGLAISKRLAEHIHASLTVESEKGVGSIFTLSVPREVFVAESRQPTKLAFRRPSELHRSVVLLVDDNVVMHQLVRSMIGDACDIDCVSTGDEALIMAASTKYDAVLLDIDLGRGKTGLQVLEEMRAFEDYDETPILAITAHALEGDRERFLQAGFDVYIGKPFRKEDLQDALESVGLSSFTAEDETNVTSDAKQTHS